MNNGIRIMGKATSLEPIRTFRDLHAWQEAHELALEIYKTSKHFPAAETYALTSQMRRAAVSITSNIAEGFSRRSPKDKQHFYSMALGSLTELQSQICIAGDLDYLDNTEVHALDAQSVTTHKLVNGLIKATTRTP